MVLFHNVEAYNKVYDKQKHTWFRCIASKQDHKEGTTPQIQKMGGSLKHSQLTLQAQMQNNMCLFTTLRGKLFNKPLSLGPLFKWRRECDLEIAVVPPPPLGMHGLV